MLRARSSPHLSHSALPQVRVYRPIAPALRIARRAPFPNRRSPRTAAGNAERQAVEFGAERPLSQRTRFESIAAEYLPVAVARVPPHDISLTAAAQDQSGFGVTGPALGQARVGSAIESVPQPGAAPSAERWTDPHDARPSRRNPHQPLKRPAAATHSNPPPAPSTRTRGTGGGL
jgi:hypothetical protein